MNIKTISIDDLKKDYYELFVELECGNHFDKENKQHIEWINNKYEYLNIINAKVLAIYEMENMGKIGFICYVHDKGLDGISCFGKKAEILEIGISEKYTSNGYGSILLKECERALISDKCECIYVNTYANNQRAQKFYIKNGFLPIAYHPYENGKDDVGQVYFCKLISQ